jgi:glycosyltransferase involved in cell wall biosynthesis
VQTCLVGAEERLFHSGWRAEEPFRALFVGKLIPLHGLDVILEAARLAPELQLRVIGSGQLDELMQERPPNVEWRDWIEYEQLPNEYWSAGCALGIFASSEKAARVIPNKAFQALACGTPLITGDTRGVRELLTDGESALLVPPGDPAALAAAMRRLAADPGLARRLGARGRETYEEQASEEVLGARWRTLIAELL